MVLVALAVILLYIVLVFVVSRFVVPNYGWRKSKLPEKLPEKWQKVVDELKKQSKNKGEFLKNAYMYITTRYTGGRFKTLLNLPLVYQDPFSHKNGYVQCNVQNYLLRALLVKSGWFEESDIQVKTTMLNFFTHQYLQVKIGEKSVAVDPHESYKGMPLGKHSQWFG